MALKLHPEGLEKVAGSIAGHRMTRSVEVIKRYNENIDRARRHVVELEVSNVIEYIMMQLRIDKEIALTKHDQDSLVQLFQTQEEAKVIVEKMLKTLEPYTKEWDLGLIIIREIEKPQRPWYLQ